MTDLKDKLNPDVFGIRPHHEWVATVESIYSEPQIRVQQMFFDGDMVVDIVEDEYEDGFWHVGIYTASDYGDLDYNTISNVLPENIAKTVDDLLADFLEDMIHLSFREDIRNEAKRVDKQNSKKKQITIPKEITIDGKIKYVMI